MTDVSCWLSEFIPKSTSRWDLERNEIDYTYNRSKTDLKVEAGIVPL